MLKIFEIYLYICGSIVSISILIGLLGLLVNLGLYAYESYIGFDTFKKFLRKYHSEMKREKTIKADASKAFKKHGLIEKE